MRGGVDPHENQAKWWSMMINDDLWWFEMAKMKGGSEALGDRIWCWSLMPKHDFIDFHSSNRFFLEPPCFMATNMVFSHVFSTKKIRFSMVFPRKYHVNPGVLDARPGVGAKIARSALCSSGEKGDGCYLYVVLSPLVVGGFKHVLFSISYMG